MIYIDNMNAPFKRMKIEKRFWSKVEKRSSTECWPWNRGTNGKRSYGRFRIDKNRVTYAHRFAFELHTGIDLSNNDVILHLCDNPICCNPNHLSKGTQQDNLSDMLNKGRASCARGENHSSAKLTVEQVMEIRSSTQSNTLLANKFGVKQNTISNIRTGKSWQSI